VADDDIRDFGIAVAEAIRLNDCYHALSDAFAARPPVEGDDALLTKRLQIYPPSPERDEWVHRVNCREVAQFYIRVAILNRDFPLWIRTALTEETVDPYAIVTVTNRMVSTGIYLTENYPKGYLERRPLRVKRTDWEPFFSDAIESRYGEKALTRALSVKAASRPSDDAIRQMIQTVHAEGAKGRAIPKAVRAKSGFESVSYKVINALAAGLFKRVGRAGSARQ
jgi:hypothetical protein